VEVDALGRVVREEAPPPPSRRCRVARSAPPSTSTSSASWRASSRPASAAPSSRWIPHTGHVLALYSSPSYDPNAFVGGIDPALWEQLNTDDARPLLDRAISTRYPPASTFKLATATIALRRGLVTPASRMPIPCTGGLQVGDRVFKCWKATGHGSLTLEQAIASSCDVYFYQLAGSSPSARSSTTATCSASGASPAWTCRGRSGPLSPPISATTTGSTAAGTGRAPWP